MQAVNSDLSTSGLLAEARRQSRDTTAGCTRAVCTERLGDTDTDIPLSNTATHPALPTCWQTSMTVSTAGKRSHTTVPFSDVQKQKAFNFIFNQFTYWLVLSTDIPEILSTSETKQCQIALFLEVFPNPTEKLEGNNFIWQQLVPLSRYPTQCLENFSLQKQPNPSQHSALTVL